MSEKRHDSSDGWSFCYPDTLQLKASASDIVLTNNRDPRNYFGFKVVLRSAPLADKESLGDGVERLLGGIKQGAAKRDHVEVRRGAAKLAGLPAQEVVLRYTLDAGRVEYVDPDGKSRSVGDEAVPLQVRLLAAEKQRTLLAAWLISDVGRAGELDGVFDGILRSLHYQRLSPCGPCRRKRDRALWSRFIAIGP